MSSARPPARSARVARPARPAPGGPPARRGDRPAGRGVAVALAAGLACAGVAGCTNSTPARFAGAQSGVVTATAGAGGVQTVDVSATMSDRFVPSTIVVHPGRVTLVVHNTGGTPHTLEIPSLGVNTGNINGKATKTVSFQVTKPGSYPFDCAYHAALGMTGVLKVVSG